MAKILAIRFSALGDVVMTIPVLWSFAQRYPMHEITLLSRDTVSPLMDYLPKNVHFKGINLRDYAGVIGLHRLYHELQEEKYDAVADLHNVIRTKYLRMAFVGDGTPTAYIDKGRKAKRHLTRFHNKELSPLTESPERYAIALAELGYPFEIHFESLLGPDGGAWGDFQNVTGEKGAFKWVGIAPFARHKGKIYPLSQMEKVISLLNEDPQTRIFLFGAGLKEEKWCKRWDGMFDKVSSLVGVLDMKKELSLMSHMDVMLTMDSANMHLASLVRTPVVSIWGATHPYAGFAGLQHPLSIQLQSDLSCRPCSIYGNKACTHGNYDCLWNIRPQQIADAVRQICKATAL